MAWDQMVPTVFMVGFCKNWSDTNNAFKWLVDLHSRKVGWAEVERQIREYLATTDWGAPFVEDQISKARDRMKPWLLD
jgi:hypothetical protein